MYDIKYAWTILLILILIKLNLKDNIMSRN